MPATPTPPPTPTTEQGPAWLADLLLSPPPWLRTAVYALGVVAVVVVAYRLYEAGFELDLATQREMQNIAATITCVATGALAMVNLGWFSYLLDVGLGWLVGMTVLKTAERVGYPDGVVDGLTKAERVSLTWIIIGVSAFVLPGLVLIRNVGYRLFGGRLVLFVLAAVVVCYNARLFEGEPIRSH